MQPPVKSSRTAAAAGSSGSDDQSKSGGNPYARPGVPAPTGFSQYSRMPLQQESGSEPADGQRSLSSTAAKAKVMGAYYISEIGCCYVEKGSIYGAAILMPQLARSMDWQRLFVIEAIRSYVLVFVSILLQASILAMLAKHEVVMDPFAGEMFLCDLGAGCTGTEESLNKGCTGPGGTTITPQRLYSYDIWATRVFIRDSLKAIFPNKKDDIDAMIDPGEYGLESYKCRLLCCLLFIMTMLQEAVNVYDMANILYRVPTAAASWIQEAHAKGTKRDDLSGEPQSSGNIEDVRVVAIEQHQEEPERIEDVEEVDWLDGVELRIAGMPAVWKAVTLLFVLVPKALVWKLTVETGIVFLMETAAIEDLVVNSIALTFILSIDEMICETLTSKATHSMLVRCKEYPLFDTEVAKLSDEQITERYGGADLEERFRCSDVFTAILPTRMLSVVFLTLIFVVNYYHSHCTWEGYAMFLPKPLFFAKTTAFTFLNAFLPSVFPIERSGEAVWQMPETE